jgi:hypothetical protein
MRLTKGVLVSLVLEEITRTRNNTKVVDITEGQSIQVQYPVEWGLQ